MPHSNSFLKKDKAYINGKWITAQNKKTFTVSNPATGEIIASVPDMDQKDTKAAISSAKAALPVWKALTAKERSHILKRWHELIISNVDELATLLTAEQGKPLKEAKAEIIGGAASVEWFAEEAKRAYGDTIPTHKNDARVIVTREPVGVVGAITPWNFPNAMITRKVAPALAAGCTIILKPAEDTPLSALALAELADQAGFPPGIFNVVTCSINNAPSVGAELTGNKTVKKISFTGSTPIGKLLMKQSADTVKKISLELGGNAPFIVFESADLDKAADGAMASKFRNAGQTCICANRIYVQDTIYDAFTEKMIQRMAKLKVGNGADNSDIGPLINAKAIDKVKQHLADATSKGAQIKYGGKTNETESLFFEPTLLTEMNDSMKIKSEETFGPIAGLFRFKDETNVIKTANDTEYGLAAYFYSNDLAQCFRVSEALEYGMIGVNECLLAAESIPFGGIKESGIGREGSKYGLEEFTELKYTLIGGL